MRHFTLTKARRGWPLVTILLAGSALLAASCGSQPATTPSPPAAAGVASASGATGLTAATPTSSISPNQPSQPPRASATPATSTAGTSPNATSSVRFVIAFNMGTGGWTLLQADSASSDSELRGIAKLLATDVPLAPAPAGTPPLTCAASDVMMLPPEHLTPRWLIGLRGGATVAVLANVAPCGATSTAYANDAYASLNGRPTRAIGLVPRLLSLARRLPPAEPLTVTPATPAPGGTVALAGDGWVGGAVAVTVAWCHQLGPSDCTVKPLATLTPDARGHIAWQGRLPASMPAAGTGYDVTIEAKNGLLDFVVHDLAR